MAHMDIFKSRHFDLVSMISAIDQVDYRPNRIQSMGLTEVRPIRTTSVSIEKRTDQGIGLIQTTPRGAPLARNEAKARDIRDFQTVRIGKMDRIYAHEIQNIRAFGSETELMQVQREVAMRLQMMEDDMSVTEEHMQLGMIQGIVVDADGSELYNWYDEFGVAPAAEIDWDLANATLSDLRQKVNALKRRMMRNAKGAQISGIHALCSDSFYDALTTHAEVEKTYLGQQEAARLRGNEADVFESFNFGGITWENYRGSDDNSTVAIANDKVRFFPSRSRGVFVEARAPGESFEVVNRPGRRRYAQLIQDRDRNEWVQPEVKSYPLFVCQRPAVLESGTV